MNIGYARVSTGEQTLDLQLDALAAADCGKVFTETASGAKAERASLQRGAGLRAAGRHPRRLAARPPRPLPQAPDRDGHRPAGAGRRLPVADRADRHDDAGRQAGLPRLRRPGRVRARPDPRADPRRPRRGAGPGAARRPAARRSTRPSWRWPGRSTPTRRHSIADICRTLGVSRATLYRALRVRDGEPPATR